MEYILALDQGTTSSRVILFDRRGALCSQAQAEFPQIYPRPGWVEHDPEAIRIRTRHALVFVAGMPDGPDQRDRVRVRWFDESIFTSRQSVMEG